MNYDLEQIKKEIQSMPEEELAKYESDVDLDDKVYQPNDYDTPSIIARYWRPALNGTEAKVLDYIIYKTFAFEKGRVGDAIALTQLLKGTRKEVKGVVVKRTDWGTGVSKPKLLDALKLLEVLGIIEVTRKVDEATGAKGTSHYRLKIHSEFDSIVDKKEIDAYLLENPFKKVSRVRNILKQKGILKGK